MRILFVLLLSSLGCLAASSTIIGSANITGHSIITSITAVENPDPYDFINHLGLGISNRWLSASLATNASITDWIDVTNSFHWIQGTSPSPPTNRALVGARFDDNIWLDSTNILRNTALVWFAIFIFEDEWRCGNGAHANQTIFWSNNSGAQTTLISGSCITGPLEVGSSGCGSLATNVQNNFVVSSGTVYTNGISCAVGNGMGAFANASRVGNFGLSGAGGQSLTGYLREFIIFTNTTITTVQVSNLNYYANQLPHL